MNTRLLLQATALAFRLKCTILEEIDFDIHEIRFLTEPKLPQVISEIRLKDFWFTL